MRVNNHVVDDLIDWSNTPNDPMFKLSIPQPEMLAPNDLDSILTAMKRPGASKVEMRAISESIRERMNPHPADQKEENVPQLDGVPVQGLQHKYRETVLFFPSEGQYCHAFCTYCFRWAQFSSVGSDQAFKSSDRNLIRQYIQRHPTVTDVLFTGGDPMVMSASTLRHYTEVLFGPDSPPHLDTIRIGTKSLAWWPYRFVADADAKETLQLFSEIVKSGKHLTIQAHFSHLREVEHPVAQEAIRLIRMTGAQVRSQAPLIRHVNEDPVMWESMWKLQTRLGVIPYYMFVERDTGAREYFSVPLARALEVFNTAYSRLPGTSRTVRGPSMSVSPGKVLVLGKAFIDNQEVFVLKFLQSRNPRWSERVFFAKFDPHVSWFDDLKPAFGETAFFFEPQYLQQKKRVDEGSSGQLSDDDWGPGTHFA
ncbi:uncharacterized protein TRUGW13939_08032 [Talaromyces rugulosus]|uniref:Radical SAM core domain-containing protein n=1 Tax=Talaromyces rugulosus TaxID=121627 RepID=A0A7H8R3Z9_TALRU|nr:uncharacterized protein TRUGW13939_08032 [Talaromyces rugulosus]QKX60886.1 hypothetical protein TRUGW13939_08032 [Talaromyces rugulosus]